jgi:ubiquinone/menaquinone biosynthesis C-methylase UbiE
MTTPFFRQKQGLFDRWATWYDWLFPSVFYQAIHTRLLEYVQLPLQPQVLDLGCGTGRLLKRLATQIPDLEGTGLDLSGEMLHQARLASRHYPQLRPRLRFVQGNAEALPFADQQFDAVFSTISFLHYPHPLLVLAEVRRVLRPQGQFYLVDPIPGCGLNRNGSLNLVGGVSLYSLNRRQQLGEQAGLCCLGHHDLLWPVVLTVFVA